MNSEQTHWRSPPKAEATSSNLVGCTNTFKVVSGFSEGRNPGRSCAVAQFPRNHAFFCDCEDVDPGIKNSGELASSTGALGEKSGRFHREGYAPGPNRTSRNFRSRQGARAVRHA